MSSTLSVAILIEDFNRRQSESDESGKWNGLTVCRLVVVKAKIAAQSEEKICRRNALNREIARNNTSHLASIYFSARILDNVGWQSKKDDELARLLKL